MINLPGNVAHVVKLHLAVAGIGKAGRQPVTPPAVRHGDGEVGIADRHAVKGVARMDVHLNLFTHFGGHIGVFDHRVVVEVDVQHRHHFIGRAGQVVGRIGKFAAIAVFEVDVYRPGGVAVGGDEIIFSRPAVLAFHLSARMFAVQMRQRRLIRHLADTALRGGRRHGVKRRPLFVIFAELAVFMAGLHRQQRTFVQVARVHHAAHMAPHVGAIHVRAGDHGENYAKGQLDVAAFVVRHHDADGRFDAQAAVMF